MTDAEKSRCIETFKSSPELRASFPVVLANGATIDVVRGICSRCQQTIDPADVHGRVSWPITSVAVVEAAGLCRACSTMTSLYVRFRVAGWTYQVEAPRPDGHGWLRVQPPPTAWWRTLIRRLRGTGKVDREGVH